MKQLHDIPFSVLDLAPIREGGTAADSFHNTLDLARHAEKWGYNRYWLAEHHNMTGIASSATSVVIGHVAAGTNTIRVGSGGIMLSNHAPLVIAEQFGTLESLYPGRIDLGLGRAPGSDQAAARALRRSLGSDGSEFPEQLSELRAYFDPEGSGSRPAGVRAVPGEGLNIPIWLLGSSGFSAQLAGQLGLPLLLPATSHRIICCRLCICTVPASSHQQYSTSLMLWWVWELRQRIRWRKRADLPLPSSSNS